TGVFELTRDPAPEEMRRLKELVVKSGVPLTFGCPDIADWRAALQLVDEVSDSGGRAFAQAHTRGISTMWSFLVHLPYDHQPVWRELRARPLDEQKAALRDPYMRTKLIEATRLPPQFQTAGTEARI